jgi:hypothetical protein
MAKGSALTLPVCHWPNPVGEPDAGNPHVRFDERGVETEQGWIFWHRQPKGPVNTHGQPTPPRHSSTLPKSVAKCRTGKNFQFAGKTAGVRKSPKMTAFVRPIKNLAGCRAIAVHVGFRAQFHQPYK